MVPCNCSPNCTHRYNLKNLENRLNRKGIIECEVTAIDVNVASLLYGIGHHTQPAYLEAKFNALDRRFDQLDLEVANWRRDFLKEFRNEQRLEESRCPNVFVLREKPLENEASLYEQGKERVSRLSHRPLELHLCCQYPKQWHLTEEGGKYPIQQPREYIKTLAPVVSKLVTILKYTTPLVGATIGAFSTELAEAMKHDFKFMEAWVKALPDIGKEEYFEQLEIGSDQPYYREELSPDRVSPVRGADLRPLKVMLEKLDDQKIWGGLTWTPTPEGDYLWLCKEHAKEFA
ncbi:MAG: hypothetical protein NT023_03915 [Armatimonadetes bacterium]|nr:hypothetical protein [Armatimonadota bacterium]